MRRLLAFLLMCAGCASPPPPEPEVPEEASPARAKRKTARRPRKSREPLPACRERTPVGCVDPRLALWCRHEENQPGPDVLDGYVPCEPVATPAGLVACGPYTVERQGGMYGSGRSRYFLGEDLVAVQYSTDLNHYCGGFSYWYGREIRCD